MKIGQRFNEIDSHEQHQWTREINGIRYHFVHVKVSRLGQPYMGVTRLDTGEMIRCSCPRPDCPASR